MTLSITVPDSRWERLEQMAARGNREQFLEAMSKVPDVEPVPGDRL